MNDKKSSGKVLGFREPDLSPLNHLESDYYDR
jgi:hypothetical protein